MSSHKSILKSFSQVSFFTLLSRILGFFRDIVIAKFFGTSAVVDAFFVAFRIPNLFRDIIGEGATSSAIIPVLSEYSVKSKRDVYIKLVLSVFFVFALILILIVFLGILFAPLIVKTIAPGFIANPEKLNLTIQLLKINFPYIFFIGLVAILMAFLNIEGIFTIPAFSPCLLNIAMILTIFFTFNRLSQPIFGLALGVLIGGFLQLLIHIIPSVRRAFFVGNKIDPVKPSSLNKESKTNNSAIKQIFTLILPRIFGTIVYQLNIFMDTILASLSWIVGEGAVSAIYYANHLVQFPLGIISTSLITATLPSLSKKIAQGQNKEHKDTVVFSLKAIFFIMIPSAVSLFILAHPIIEVLFQRGQFNSYSTNITSFALMFFSLGLPFYASARVLASNFYSRQDTITPVKVAFWALLVNLILNLVLMWPLKVGGLALASAVSSFFNFFMLHKFYKAKNGDIFDKQFYKFITKIIFSSIILGVFLFYFWRLIRLLIIVKLGLAICLGLSLYVIITHLLGIKKISEIIKWILKRQ